MMLRLSRSLLVALLLSLSLLASSQAEAQAVTDYRLSIYNLGAASPITTFTFPAAQALCGQAVLAVSGTQANPTQIRFLRDAGDTTDCVRDETAGGPLFALPFSLTLTYDSTLAAISSAGVSPESARSHPFVRPGAVRPAPSNLRLRRP